MEISKILLIMAYLLDTNICIYIIKKKSLEVLANLKKKASRGISISSLTLAELEFGIEKSNFKEKNRIALIEFLSIFTILSFDDYDAIEYGKLRAILEKSGKIIGTIDMLLASQALAKDLIFVTNNSKEFMRVPYLKIENWTGI